MIILQKIIKYLTLIIVFILFMPWDVFITILILILAIVSVIRAEFGVKPFSFSLSELKDAYPKPFKTIQEMFKNDESNKEHEVFYIVVVENKYSINHLIEVEVFKRMSDAQSYMKEKLKEICDDIGKEHIKDYAIIEEDDYVSVCKEGYYDDDHFEINIYQKRIWK